MDNNYKDLLLNHLLGLESHSGGVYDDSRGLASVGIGLNLNDEEVQKQLKLHGYDPELIRSKQQFINEDDSKTITNNILDKKEEHLKSLYKQSGYPIETFDNLKPNEKAALLSTAYNTINPIKNNLVKLAQGDKVGFTKDLIGSYDEPGILYRRLKDAQLFADPVEFAGAFKIMSPKERQKHLDALNSIENEHTRKERLNEFGSYLQEPKQTYPTLNRLLDINPNLSPLKKD